MGDGGFVNVNVKVNESSNRFYRRGAEDAEGILLGDREVRECESPRVSGQTIPRDADLRMGGGRFEGASVNVNESMVAGSNIHVNVRRSRAVRR